MSERVMVVIVVNSCVWSFQALGSKGQVPIYVTVRMYSAEQPLAVREKKI